MPSTKENAPQFGLKDAGIAALTSQGGVRPILHYQNPQSEDKKSFKLESTKESPKSPSVNTVMSLFRRPCAPKTAAKRSA